MASKNKKLSIAVDLLSHDIDGVVRKIPLNQITPSEDQPRSNKDINIEKLSKSLTEQGLLQPIVVTKKNENHFQIIAGERRFRAAKLAGWEEIECKILSTNTIDTYKLAVIENIQRENLNPIEEAIAFKKLKTMFAYTDQQLSEIIGKSRNYISEILSIAEIPEDIRTKAEAIGIKSRNIFVQLAHAVKNNCENEFLQSYQKGNIGTVKNAKQFLQHIKSKKNSEFSNPISNAAMPLIDIKYNNESPTELLINIHINQMQTSDLEISKLEKILKKQILRILYKNS